MSVFRQRAHDDVGEEQPRHRCGHFKLARKVTTCGWKDNAVLDCNRRWNHSFSISQTATRDERLPPPLPGQQTKMEAFLRHFPDSNPGWKPSFGISQTAIRDGSLPPAFPRQQLEMEAFLRHFPDSNPGWKPSSGISQVAIRDRSLPPAFPGLHPGNPSRRAGFSADFQGTTTYVLCTTTLMLWLSGIIAVPLSRNLLIFCSRHAGLRTAAAMRCGTLRV